MSRALCALVAACAKPALAPSGINIATDRSDYAPTARLAVALAPLTATGDTLEIVIDSGSLAVPGEVGGRAGVMFNVHIAALVVTSAAKQKNKALQDPWLALAESDSQLVLPTIAGGERRSIGPLRFRVPRTRQVAASAEWVVFRITGTVIPRIARMEGQQAARTLPGAKRFRVYACADWNLAGRVDRARAKVMKTSYLKLCSSAT